MRCLTEANSFVPWVASPSPITLTPASTLFRRCRSDKPVAGVVLFRVTALPLSHSVGSWVSCCVRDEPGPDDETVSGQEQRYGRVLPGTNRISEALANRQDNFSTIINR